MQIQCPRHLERCQWHRAGNARLLISSSTELPSSPAVPDPFVPMRDSPRCPLGMGEGCWKRCSWDSRFRPEQPPPRPASPALACPQPPQRGLRETLPFPGHDPKSFTRVPALAAFPSQDFALIWRFPELVGGNWTLLGSDCISGWGHSRRHLAWLLRDQGGCPPTCPPPACSLLIPAPLLPGALVCAPGPHVLVCAFLTSRPRTGKGQHQLGPRPSPRLCAPGGPAVSPLPLPLGKGTDLQGADSNVAESPPGPLALELMPAGEVSLGTGIPGGRCEVQPGSCQYILRED